MNSLNIKTKIEAAVMVAATVFLGAGCASMHREARYNASPAPITASQEEISPGYAMGGVPPGYETETGNASSWNAAGNLVIPLEKETLNVGTREVPAGEIRIHKFVKTETINQPVQLRTESVSVERVPASAAPTANQGQLAQGNLGTPFQEGDMVIHLRKEEPFVQTEIVPAGSVVVNKQENTQTVNVQRKLRQEDVAAVPIGNPENVHISGNLAPAPGYAAIPEDAYGSADEAAGTPPSPYGQTSGAGNGPTITHLRQLTAAPDPAALAGQQVEFASVPVQRVLGAHVILIGPPNGPAVCVRTAQPLNGLRSGERVSINGIVQQAPSTPSTMGFDQQSAQALQGQRIFIDARNIAPANQ